MGSGLKNYKICDKCGKPYDISPFADMTGNGESRSSTVTLYGENFDLCPMCTFQIYTLITKKKEGI